MGYHPVGAFSVMLPAWCVMGEALALLSQWHCSAGYSRRNSDGARPRSQAARPRTQSGPIRRVRGQDGPEASGCWLMGSKWVIGTCFLRIIMIPEWKGLDPNVNGRTGGTYQEWLDFFWVHTAVFFVLAGTCSVLLCLVPVRLQNVTNGYSYHSYKTK